MSVCYTGPVINREKENASHACLRSADLPLCLAAQCRLRQKCRRLHVCAARRTDRTGRDEIRRQRRRRRCGDGRGYAAARADRQRPRLGLLCARVDRAGQTALRPQRQWCRADGAERREGSRDGLYRDAEGRMAADDGARRTRRLGGAEPPLRHEAARRAVCACHFLCRGGLSRAGEHRAAVGARQPPHCQGDGGERRAARILVAELYEAGRHALPRG